jgi:hypothetical protein
VLDPSSVVGQQEAAGVHGMSDSRDDLDGDLRPGSDCEYLAQLGGHAAGAPDLPVQGQFVYDEPRGGRPVPSKYALLAFHPAGQPAIGRVLCDVRLHGYQRARVLLGLQQAVDDRRRPDAQAGCLVFVLSSSVAQSDLPHR